MITAGAAFGLCIIIGLLIWGWHHFKNKFFNEGFTAGWEAGWESRNSSAERSPLDPIWPRV